MRRTMGCRFEKRVPMRVSVRVMGVSEGKAFTVNAETTDVTATGVRLVNVHIHLKSGDVLTVQYKLNRARYKVMWSREDGQLGLRLADPGKLIWGKPIARILGDDYKNKPDPSAAE
jgi:hypothetical protein